MLYVTNNPPLIESLVASSSQAEIPSDLSAVFYLWQFTLAPEQMILETPLSIHPLPSFLADACYVCLLSRRGKDATSLSLPIEFHDSVSLAITPRGLSNPLFCSTPSTSSPFSSDVFVWNGKSALPFCSAFALARGYFLLHALRGGCLPLRPSLNLAPLPSCPQPPLHLIQDNALLLSLASAPKAPSVDPALLSQLFGAFGSQPPASQPSASQLVSESGGMSMKERLARFDPQCNKVTERLFLGSETVAKNKALLEQNGVTHILNCAGTICLEYFPDSFSYKYLSLVDGKAEDVSCLLYDVIEWFEDTLAADPKHKIFVHCQQGVSRSSTMIIAYLMWAQRTPFEPTMLSVKEKRDICNPNQNFYVQLLDFWRRISPPQPPLPRLYRIQPHTVYSPELIVSKHLPLSRTARASSFIEVSLDTRGVFLLAVPAHGCFVWRGAKSHPILLDAARVWARRYAKFEHFPDAVVQVDQDAASPPPAPFLEALGLTAMPEIGEQPSLDHIYQKILPMTLSGESLRVPYRAQLREQLLSSGIDPTKSDNLSFSTDQSSSAVTATSSSAKVHARLFQAPAWESMGTFDIDDLSEDELFALVVQLPRTEVYIWVGGDYDGKINSKKARALARACLEKNPNPAYSKNPVVHLIHADEEPPQFWTYFQ